MPTPVPPPYPIDFRARIVGLVRAGRPPGELAREFGLSPETIRGWVEQAEWSGVGRADGAPGGRRM